MADLERKYGGKEYEINFNVGDCVIRKDGLKGKISKIARYSDGELYQIFITYENREVETLTENELSRILDDFYLWGKVIIGNKCTDEEMQDFIEAKKAEVKQLRKQAWRVKYQMLGYNPATAILNKTDGTELNPTDEEYNESDDKDE